MWKRIRIVTLVALLGAASSVGIHSVDQGLAEWPSYGGDLAGSKYSPLTDINRENVGRLQAAWEWQPHDRPHLEFKNIPGNFSSTPTMVDNVLYVSTSFATAAAIDAESGRELWNYDPHIYEEPQGQAAGWNHRGLTPWRDGENLRIFIAAKRRLISLDAKTGKPVETFGSKGEVDVSAGLQWDFDKVLLSNQSAPTVYKDLVIIGSGVGDRLTFRHDPPGAVRAYHARTGKEAWTFHVVPMRGEYGTDTWENDSWQFTGHANVWTAMSVDVERGLVYLPTSTPSNDYYGGRRLGANLFAESLVCLDAATGKRKWHFQAVHHGLWDYDFPAQPNLVTITVDGRPIDAVAQVSKQGWVFVFDRVTGKPVWPIEERPVPTGTDVPGERPYPTQPFPTKPPPFGLQGFGLEDAFDLTPELKAAAQAEIKKYRYGPLFTPPSLQGTLQRPHDQGAGGWGGGAWDQESGLLFVKSSDIPRLSKIEKFRRGTSANPFAALTDVDYLDVGGRVTFADGLPVQKPPYATLNAIDLNKGEIRWRVPFGKGSDSIRTHPALKGVALPDRLGTVGPPGAIVTRGGLVFIGGSDTALYAFDKETGQELWHADLPRPATGTPMTYRSRSGRQFVVIATGSGTDAALVAFALPKGQ